MTLLGNLADLNDAVDWKVSARPPISNPSNLLTKSLGIVQSAAITIGIIVTLFSDKFEVLASLFAFFSVVRRIGKVCYLCSLLIITRSALLIGIR